MGVPGFFGWLVQHCGAALVAARAPKSKVTDTEKEENNAQKARLSRTQMDCLYLDMNGIIHPCCHGDATSTAHNDEAAMMRKVCAKVDELMELVQPTTLLFLAIDGTAPRAKMNQQRTRRFRAAQLREVEADITQQVKAEWSAAKIPCPTAEDIAIWDSNVITPGTPFMEKLYEHLKFYITTRLQNHPLWANVTVVLTGSNEPGEGEHKIIQYIKRQRLSPGYDPNLKHCIAGEDADLIILAMSTHTPHVYILRGARPPKGLRGKALEEYPKYNYLVISIVVGYFERVFAPLLNDDSLPSARRQLPRMLDDLALVFCLVGNDFLPHVPGMKIQHNALGVALLAYIEAFQEFGGAAAAKARGGDDDDDDDAVDGFGDVSTAASKKKKRKGEGQTEGGGVAWYLTDNGDVSLSNLRVIIGHLWKNFRTVDTAAAFKAAAEAMVQRPPPEPPTLDRIAAMVDPMQRRAAFLETVRYHVDRHVERDIEEQKANDQVNVGVKGWEDRHYLLNFPEMQDVVATAADAGAGHPREAGEKRKAHEAEGEEEGGDFDTAAVAAAIGMPTTAGIGGGAGVGPITGANPTAHLTAAGRAKLAELKKDVAREYVRGLVWVVAYYFKDCPAWGWFYPYHYAPVLGTIDDSGAFEEAFGWDLGSPYTPFEQLSAVLPKTTASKVLPREFCKWTASSQSPLKKFFPMDFHVDLRACPPPWHCTVILPFIEDGVFRPILKKLQKKHAASEDLKRRNRRALPLVFVGRHNKTMYAAMEKMFAAEKIGPPPAHEFKAGDDISDAKGSPATKPGKAARGKDAAPRPPREGGFGMSMTMRLPRGGFDRAEVVAPGSTCPTVFDDEAGKEAYPTLENVQVAAVCAAWPELRNRSMVLEGTETLDLSTLLQPGRTCRKPSFSFQSSTVSAGLPLVLRPGRQLDALQPHWAVERVPCWNFTNFGHCKYGNECHYAHDVAPKEGQRHQQQPAKTPCRHFASSKCTYGDTCRYSHEDANANANGVKKDAPRSGLVAATNVEGTKEVEEPAAKKKSKKKKAAAAAEEPPAPLAADAGKLKRKRAVEAPAAEAETGAPAKRAKMDDEGDMSKVYVTAGPGATRDALAKYIERRSGTAPALVKWRMPGGKPLGEMVVRFASDEEGRTAARTIRGKKLPGGSAKLTVVSAKQ